MCSSRLARGARANPSCRHVKARYPRRPRVSCAEPRLRARCRAPRCKRATDSRYAWSSAKSHSPRRPRRAAAATAALRASAAGPADDERRAARRVRAPLLDALQHATPRARRCSSSTSDVALGCSRSGARAAKRAGVRARVIGIEREPALAALATRVLAANGAALAPSTLSAAARARPPSARARRRCRAADIVVAESSETIPSPKARSALSATPRVRSGRRRPR